MILGIDIGTSSICLLAARESGEVLAVLSHPNDAALPPPGHTSQDPERIWQIVEELACQLKGRLLEPVEAVGISCQMHGILYLDRQGRPVSPLYTWQDPRGGLPAGLGAGPGQGGCELEPVSFRPLRLSALQRLWTGHPLGSAPHRTAAAGRSQAVYHRRLCGNAPFRGDRAGYSSLQRRQLRTL